MRILLTGGSGQIGGAIKSRLSNHEVVAPARSEFDLERIDDIEAYVADVGPDLLINCAAFTAVDDAENETGRAAVLNGIVPGILAIAARKCRSSVVHISTDYVFDGNSKEPYHETDNCAPLNVYGKTKLDGERAVAAAGAPYLIVRTSWIYSSSGRNFLLTMLRLGKEHDVIDVVDDQIGAPTSATAVASVIAAAVAKLGADADGYFRQRGGVLNVACTGQTTWFGFAAAIFEEARERGMSLRVEELRPVKTIDFRRPAKRPAYSLFDLGRLEHEFGIVPPSWRVALTKVMDELARPVPHA